MEYCELNICLFTSKEVILEVVK